MEPKRPAGILDKLVWYATFREPIAKARLATDQTGLATEQTPILTQDEVTQCFNAYLQWFEEHEASVEQKQAKNLRNMALARMHNDIGNNKAAFAVWEIGLPRDLYSRFNFNREVTSPADSKGVIPKALLQSMLSEEGQLLLKEHIKHVTSWLRKIANAIQSRKQTDAYKDVRAHAGEKNVSGLEPEEQERRRCERKLHADLAWAKQLYDKWSPSLQWKKVTTNRNQTCFGGIAKVVSNKRLKT